MENLRSHLNLSGEHLSASTQAEVNKMAKAYHKGTGITIITSETQLGYN